MTTTQPILSFDPPVVLDLRSCSSGRRPRVVDGSAPPPAGPPEPVWETFEELAVYFQLDGHARTIRAYIPPIPGGLEIYGPADFAAAAADTPEAHLGRVRRILGTDPSTILQALIDGDEMPALPPRVPREIQNWRGKAILAQMGLLATVEGAIAALPEPERTVAGLAWNGDAKLARNGKTVLGLSAALGLSDAQVDALFIAAEALEA